MNRTIKYKAYDKKTKKIAEVLVIDWLNSLVDLTFARIERNFDEVKLLQYTGLKDKNCVDIYGEGYILRVQSPKGEFLAKVVYSIGTYGLEAIEGRIIDYFTDNWNDDFISLLDIYWNNNDEDEVIESVEVVGDIYTNPELLDN